MNDFEKQKMSVLKEKTKTVEGTDMIKMILKAVKEKEDKTLQAFREALSETLPEVTNALVERALLDKLFTEKEFKQWCKKYDAQVNDFEFLIGYYTQIDNNYDKTDKTVIVTLEGTTLHRMKHLVKKRFGVYVRTIEEAVKLMRKQERK